MPDDPPPTGRFNVSFGNVSKSQVVMGDHNTVTQHVGLSAAETAELRAVFAGLADTVQSDVAPELRAVALAETTELERAVLAPEPDPNRARAALRWFREHAPQLAGVVVSVLVHPLVGKAVEGAGDAIAEQFAQLVRSEL